jgi:1-acyl-sn-glycerol-3-phosphate acyltransferase
VQYRMSRLMAGPFLYTLWRPKMTGEENIPVTGGAILASNHLSIVDSIFLPLLVSRPVTFAAKAEYFTSNGIKDRLTGAYMRGTGQLPVDRDAARAAQDMLDSALALLNEGKLFGIYPEGTRSPDGRLYRGRTGVSWLALHARVPVIPVAMSGTDRVLPPGQTMPRFNRIKIKIGEPMTFEKYEGTGARERRAVADEVMAAIQKLSGQEYVPMYASARKAEIAAAQDGASGNGQAGPAE